MATVLSMMDQLYRRLLPWGCRQIVSRPATRLIASNSQFPLLRRHAGFDGCGIDLVQNAGPPAAGAEQVEALRGTRHLHGEQPSSAIAVVGLLAGTCMAIRPWTEAS